MGSDPSSRGWAFDDVEAAQFRIYWQIGRKTLLGRWKASMDPQEIMDEFCREWLEAPQEGSDLSETMHRIKCGIKYLVSFYHAVLHDDGLRNECQDDLDFDDIAALADELEETILSGDRNPDFEKFANLEFVALARALDSWIPKMSDRSGEADQIKLYGPQEDHVDHYEENSLREAREMILEHSGGYFATLLDEGRLVASCWLFPRYSPIPPDATIRLDNDPIIVAFQKHRVFPARFKKVPVEILDLAPSLQASPRQLLLSGEPVKVYFGGYFSTRDHHGMVAGTGTQRGEPVDKFFSPDGGLNVDERREELKSHLEQATRLGCAIAILPELTICPDLVKELKLKLSRNKEVASDLIILPGTYHVEIEADPAGKDQKPKKTRVNRAEVISGDGLSLLVQDKRIRFKARSDEGRIEEEWIHTKNPLRLGSVARRLLSVQICKDFIDNRLASTWRDLDISLIMVPSMGDKKTERQHLSRLKNLRLLRRTSGAVCQESFERAKNGDAPVWFSSYCQIQNNVPDNGDTEGLHNDGGLIYQVREIGLP